MYNYFYRMPRLKNLREVMKAECYYAVLFSIHSEILIFSLFFFACTKKKQKKCPDYYWNREALRSALMQSGEKLQSLMRPTGNENSVHPDAFD